MKRPDWLSDEMYPFESKFAQIGRASVHYVDEGSGAPLLFMHGNPTWSFVYRDIIRSLRDSFRCIAPDLPGFGLSTAPPNYGYTPDEHADVMTDFVDYLGLTNLTMMVQDWGGPIGFAAATRLPDRFHGFIIGNTWAWEKTDARTWLFSTLMGGPIGRSLIMRRNMFVERVLPSGVKTKSLTDDVMQAYRGPFLNREARQPIAVLPGAITHSQTFLKRVESGIGALGDRPALILWPTNDIAFGTADLRRWESIFPNHRVIMLPGAGHYMQEDAPNDIISGIRTWMSQPGVHSLRP